jgi:hypothetical protein
MKLFQLIIGLSLGGFFISCQHEMPEGSELADRSRINYYSQEDHKDRVYGEFKENTKDRHGLRFIFQDSLLSEPGLQSSFAHYRTDKWYVWDVKDSTQFDLVTIDFNSTINSIFFALQARDNQPVSIEHFDWGYAPVCKDLLWEMYHVPRHHEVWGDQVEKAMLWLFGEYADGHEYGNFGDYLEINFYLDSMPIARIQFVGFFYWPAVVGEFSIFLFELRLKPVLDRPPFVGKVTVGDNVINMAYPQKVTSALLPELLRIFGPTTKTKPKVLTRQADIIN